MRIAIIGDVHDRQDRLDAILDRIAGNPPELTLLVGDVGQDPPWSEPDRQTQRQEHDASVRRVLARIRGRLGCSLAFVPGNHDLRDAAPDVDGVNCDRRIVGIAERRIAGFGGAGPACFGFPYEWSETEADHALGSLLADAEPVDILISHTPPARTSLDRTAGGTHVGSQAVRRWIGKSRPRLFVCGHIHESWGVEHVDGVPCLNAGALGNPFGEEIVWLVEWSPDGPTAIRSYHGPAGDPSEHRDWL